MKHFRTHKTGYAFRKPNFFMRNELLCDLNA